MPWHWKLARERAVGRSIARRATPAPPELGEQLPILPPTSTASPPPPAQHAIDLTVVGPELPLDRGIADRFRRRGTPDLRPLARRGAARVQQGVRQGLHGAPRRADRAVPRLRGRRRGPDVVRSGEFGFPVVIKADGLAGGKGVVVAADREDGRRRHRRRHVGAAVRRRRRPRRHRGVPDRPRGVVLRAVRRHIARRR
jgi:phosphoribosylamine---glycine ligase